jgi:NADPH:quinone reductase-like Zn-dependent oxidoreductase
MKAIQITASTGLDSLQLNDIATPTPGHGEVLIRIRAVSLNYRDYMNVVGLHGITGPIPRVPCSDGAGEVAALGEGVADWKIGDRVVIPFMPQWLDGDITADYQAKALGAAVDGLMREYAVLPASSLLRIPDYLSYDEAATLPCAAVTAWNALIVRGQLKPGETVLVLGTGGVSTFALQIAKLAGARVLAITSSDEKAQRLLGMGADAVHNYKLNADWDVWANQQTHGLGVDKVVEIGGPDTLNRSIKSTRFAGHIALIGVLTGMKGDVLTALLLRKAIRLDGTYVGSRAMFAALLKTMTQHQLRPVIDSTFELTTARAAFERMASGEHVGKIVVRV